MTLYLRAANCKTVLLHRAFITSFLQLCRISIHYCCVEQLQCHTTLGFVSRRYTKISVKHATNTFISSLNAHFFICGIFLACLLMVILSCLSNLRLYLICNFQHQQQVSYYIQPHFMTVARSDISLDIF